MGINRRKNEYHVWHPFTQMMDFLEYGIMFVEGHGVYLKDEQGNEYLNAMSSLWNVNCGLGRQEIIEAMEKQLRTLAYHPLVFSAHPTAEKLASKLVEITPEPLRRVFFTNTGSGSIETALMMVRQYFRLKGEPERYRVISLRGSYHGVTMAALAATGNPSDHKKFAPLLPGFLYIPAPYCYRCEFGLTHPSCGLECAKELERTIQREGSRTIGAFIIEPVMGVAGIIIPPDDYFPAIRQICDKYGVLLIFDEVTTGFGRLGSMFAANHWNVCPDIMALAKGISSGYAPLGAVMTTDKIYERFLGDEDYAFTHGGTTSGHPVCCAAGLTTIEIIEKENLVGNAKKVGKYFIEKCSQLSDHPHVGEIRGIGLMIGIELVEDKKTKEKITPGQLFVISTRLLKAGLLAYSMGNTISFLPPLIFTQRHVDHTFSIIETVFERIRF